MDEHRNIMFLSNLVILKEVGAVERYAGIDKTKLT